VAEEFSASHQWTLGRDPFIDNLMLLSGCVCVSENISVIAKQAGLISECGLKPI
jgi:hypothetical protein